MSALKPTPCVQFGDPDSQGQTAIFLADGTMLGTIFPDVTPPYKKPREFYFTAWIDANLLLRGLDIFYPEKGTRMIAEAHKLGKIKTEILQKVQDTLEFVEAWKNRHPGTRRLKDNPVYKLYNQADIDPRHFEELVTQSVCPCCRNRIALNFWLGEKMWEFSPR